jgi:hypothetical protein
MFLGECHKENLRVRDLILRVCNRHKVSLSVCNLMLRKVDSDNLINSWVWTGGGGDEWKMPPDSGNGGWGRGIPKFPQEGPQINPNIGNGTGSNSRTSTDWYQRHPEELPSAAPQTPPWQDRIRTAQPENNFNNFANRQPNGSIAY